MAPVPFARPFSCRPFLVYFVIAIFFLLILALAQAEYVLHGQGRFETFFQSLTLYFFVALSIYLLCCMGYEGWAWVITLVMGLVGTIILVIVIISIVSAAILMSGVAAMAGTFGPHETSVSRVTP